MAGLRYYQCSSCERFRFREPSVCFWCRRAGPYEPPTIEAADAERDERKRMTGDDVRGSANTLGLDLFLR